MITSDFDYVAPGGLQVGLGSFFAFEACTGVSFERAFELAVAFMKDGPFGVEEVLF